MIGREHCNGCRFWLPDAETVDPNDSGFGFGKCRHAPPVLIDSLATLHLEPPKYRSQTDPEDGLDSIAIYVASRHPVTFATDWCGSFDPASVPPVGEAA